MARWMILVLLGACSVPAPMADPDAADAFVPAFDTGHDSGSVDAGHDAGFDSGPSCECQAADGACCDGCHFRAASYVLPPVLAGTECNSTSNCGAWNRIYRQSFNDYACDGTHAAPVPVGDHVVNTDCEFPSGPSGPYRQYGRCSLVGGAHCVDGPTCGSEY